MLNREPSGTSDQICKDTGISKKRCSKIEDVDEVEHLLLFVDKGDLSRVEHVPYTVADFDEGKKCSAKLIERKNAVFSVVRNPRVYLMLIFNS